MPDIIITPSIGKLEFIDNSAQTTRRHSFTLDHSDGLVLDAPLSAAAISAPLNVINVTVNNSNANYPFVLAQSGETGAKNLLMDGAGGTYNPFTNTATIDISGNSATATLASNSTNLGGVAAASYVTLTGTQTLTNKTITGTFTGNLTGTGSWATNAVSAVSATTATNSTQLNGQAASYYTNIPARLGYTPVNQAGDTIGNLTVNGNFTVNGSFTAFSASNIYLSSSVLTVEDNILTLNAFSPYLRYAGIEMYDSGSGTLSQLLWDGDGDYFFLTGSSVNGKIITGPDGQTNLTSNYIPKATAGYKLGNSLIYDNGTNVAIGTTSPAQKLDVIGNIRCVPVSSAWAEGLSFSMPDTSSWGGLRWRRERANADGNHYIGYVGTDTTDDLVFGSNNAGTQIDNNIRITKAGLVGIGTSSPVAKLHVVGVISGSSFSGAGTGLTGTAASLTAGTATIANGVATGAVKSGGLEENSVITSKIADGNVTNVKLASSSVTIGSSAVSLGSTLTTIAGLTSVTSTTFVGALTGNASTATNSTQLGGVAAASYVTLTGTETLTNKTITGTFTGALTGNASTSTIVNGTNGQLLFKDIRAIAPNNIANGYFQFGFTSWTNNNNSPYADYLHLRSYTDSSGGNDNLVMFRKDVIGMRIWQQTFGSATNYSSYKDVCWTDGTNASGTWAITSSWATNAVTALNVGNGTITIAAGTGVGVGSSNTFTTNQSGATTVTISNSGVTSNVAGTGISVSGATGAVTITNSSPNATHTGDVTGATALTIANDAVTTVKILNANVTNAKLANSSLTIGSTAISLGATATTIAGLTSVTSTTFVGALTGNASTATNVAWSGITSKPTTLSGFGITDAASINGASNQNFSANSIYPYEWIRFMVDAGIYWQSGTYAGWHIHPQALWGMSFRSNAATDCGLQLRRSDATSLGAVYADGTSIGFLTAAFGWGASFTVAGTMNRGTVPLGRIETITAYTILGNNNASAAAVPSALTPAQVATMLSGQTMNIAGSSTSCTGNAATATSADNIDGRPFVNTNSNSATNADSINSNGISYYTGGVTNFSGNATDGGLYSQAYSNDWQHQIAGDYRSGQIALRGKNSGTWQSWRRVLDDTNSPYALNMNQYVRTTDTCSFAGLTVSNTINGSVTGNAGTVTNGLYTTGGQTIAGITYFSNGESINAYGIRGRFTNEYLHLYNKVGVGHPSGWGQGETSTPTQGLSTYGGLNIAYGDNGISTFNGVIRANSNIRQGADLAMPLASWGVGGTSTGMVIFSFPGNTSNYGMVHCVFDIYEYNSNAVSTVIVGGHNWNGGWYNTGANVIGRCGKSVRLGVKDSKFCVVFGGAASSWEYGTIILRKIHNGGFYTGIMDMGGSFTTQQTTTESFSNISGDLRLLRTSADFIADGGVTGTSFSGAGTGLTGTASSLSIGGNATTATTLQTGRAINGVSFNGSAAITVDGLNYSVNNVWLRENGDDAQFQMYGNSRTMIYRTDGNTNPHGGGGYAHIFYYGGSADANRMFIINTDGRLWSNYHGWLDAMSITGNAATAGGLAVHGGRNNEANKIVRTDSNGYIQAGWINTPSGDMPDTESINKIYCSSDDYVRYKGVADFKQQIGLTYKNATPRSSNTTDTNYWTGVMGWGTTDLNDVATWGSGFFDTWSSPGNGPGTTSHYVGLQAFHYSGGANNAYGFQMVSSTNANRFHLRSAWPTWQGWVEMLTSGNYNSFAPTLTGTGASGTWAINVTGNAATTTILQTARNINGTSFNGSAAITTATWGTARTLTIGSTGKSVDGSAAIAWSLAEIGAAATNQTMFIGTTSVAINRASSAITLTGTSIDGNAATATSATSATYLNSSNYIQRIGSSGNYNTDFQNTPAGSVRHQGDDYSQTNSPGGTWWFYDNYRHSNNSNYWGIQVAWGWEDNANKLATRNITGNSFGGWIYYLNSNNYTDYTVTKTGTGASGTWGINITGNAATATTATNVTIANGSVTLAKIENITAYTILGNSNASAAATPAALSVATVATMLSGQTMNINGSSTSISGFGNPTTAASANTIAYRDGNGDLSTRYFFGSYQNSSDDISTGNISHIMAKFGDNYHRSATAAKVAAFITGQTMNINGSSTSCSGNAATATLATKASTLSQGGGNGTGMTFNWSGQSGQPTWLWGSNDGTNIYVWNPSNFNVNYATSAGSATSATTAGSCSGNAATATNVAASGITGQTGMWTSAVRPGPYRLYRNDDNSAYNVQLTWQAHRTNYWSLRGYLNDTFHAECFVVYSGYADSAGSAGALTTGNTYQVANLGINVAASNKLHINGDNANPAIRVDNGAVVLAASVASNGRGFYGWLPISIGGTTKWIQLYNT